MNNHANIISTLAKQVQLNADILASFVDERGLRLSLSVDGDSLNLEDADNATLQAKADLLGSLKELQSVVKGPLGILMDMGANELVCLHAVSRFQIAQSLDLDEEVSFDDLSKRCGLNTKDLQRILRYLMTEFIFCEPEPGIVAHTATSQLLARENFVQDWVGNLCDIRFPASAKAVDALEKYGVSRNPAESGFSLSRNTARGLYDELIHSPHEYRRWNGAMSALAQQTDIQWVLSSFLQVLQWIKSPVIVDVGGGRGDISLGLAENLPTAHFIVQDCSSTALEQGKLDAARFGNRIEFCSYDFRDIQPYGEADVYYFRNIFHNWPDHACVGLLQNQIPALRSGAWILIDDLSLHEPKTMSWTEERKRRGMDITMLVYFGSRERSIADWRDLLAKADTRFELKGVDTTNDQPDTILRVQWTG